VEGWVASSTPARAADAPATDLELILQPIGIMAFVAEQALFG
jgi:hypothetical protein